MGTRTMRAGGLALALAFGIASPAVAQRDRAASSARGMAPELGPGVTATATGFAYTIAAGDTLSDVAVRFEVSLADLLAWNEGLEADRVRAGQTIRIENGLRRVLHTVQAGESLSRLAARYQVRIREILTWNPRLDADRVHAGRILTIFTRVPESRSRSIGSPDRGRLEEAIRLAAHPAYRLRRPTRAYGTEETVRWLTEAFDTLRREDPETPRVEVHDLSHPEGGPINGHHSHTSGRDADVTYYQRRCPSGTCPWRRVSPDQLDAPRQWRLFREWLESDRVEAIFVDHALQAALFEEARAQGASRAELNRWFQYPRAIEDRYGVIRHEPQHADHFHVRFVCPETDPDCH